MIQHISLFVLSLLQDIQGQCFQDIPLGFQLPDILSFFMDDSVFLRALVGVKHVIEVLGN